MVLISVVREYIGRMLQDISGMKVLILDSQTVSIVSVAYSQSELLQKEVFWWSCFSNILKVTQIQVLADSDEQEVVQQVQEFFADFCAIDPYHFTLNLHMNYMYMLPAVVDPPSSQSFCDRIVDGIAAVFLAIKPTCDSISKNF
ncbi:hypothetical protein HPP92_000135 [Vanilla planifolia]|uniref:Uncharacterized protein n=1 Tax=Vanilla planifolia TaxID=51239 RepID=A0A835VK89_VANPL|nr:hypothetical protein HPP92_000135 [Vanilla planifolia]